MDVWRDSWFQCHPLYTTDFSIIIGSVYLFLPMMIMTLVGVPENIDDDLLEAAQPWAKSFKRLLQHLSCQLSLPGMIVGSILVFTGQHALPSNPQLLGGNKQMILATFAFYQRATTVSVIGQVRSVIALVMIVRDYICRYKGIESLAKSMDKRGGDIA